MKSAFIILILALVFSSCSRKSQKELYEEADAAYSQQHFQAAIDLFRETVSRDPSTAYAESSQYRIALTYNNDMHQTRQSLDAYREFRKMFPESKESRTALFLMGFLYNNDLHETDSAKAMYEHFLQLYPDDQLAASAKFELESLGKDAAHLLPTEKLAEQPVPQKEKPTSRKR